MTSVRIHRLAIRADSGCTPTSGGPPPLTVIVLMPGALHVVLLLDVQRLRRRLLADLGVGHPLVVLASAGVYDPRRKRGRQPSVSVKAHGAWRTRLATFSKSTSERTLSTCSFLGGRDKQARGECEQAADVLAPFHSTPTHRYGTRTTLCPTSTVSSLALIAVQVPSSYRRSVATERRITVAYEARWAASLSPLH